MTFSSKWFRNDDCEYYPCHGGIDHDEYSCKYCYCPIFNYQDCGGEFVMLPSGVKDCSSCKLPHCKQNDDIIINKIRERIFI